MKGKGWGKWPQWSLPVPDKAKKEKRCLVPRVSRDRDPVYKRATCAPPQRANLRGLRQTCSLPCTHAQHLEGLSRQCLPQNGKRSLVPPLLSSRAERSLTQSCPWQGFMQQTLLLYQL